MEVAAGRRVGGIRHLALEEQPLAAQSRVRLGHRSEERLRVGMLGGGEERFGRRQLDDAAHVHHGHAVTHQPHHRQVMGHEEIGEPELGLEVLHQVEDLGLHRDVEGGHGLVGHHEARIEGEGARDADALALPPAEGVGIAPHVLGPEPDQAEELGHAGQPLLPVAHAVGHERLGHDVEERSPRIERGERVLEDHLHLAAKGLELALGQGRHVEHLPARRVEEDATRRGGERAQDAARGGGLAAPALSDQRQRLAFLDVEAHIVHRAHTPTRRRRKPLRIGKCLRSPCTSSRRTAPGGLTRRGLHREGRRHRARRPRRATAARSGRSGPA